MNIIIISRKEIPEFIKQYLQNHNTKIFYSRGPIKCQSIFEKTNIHYILLFIDKNIKKIFNDLLLILNQKNIPVIIVTKENSVGLQQELKYYYFTISQNQAEEKFLASLTFCLQNNPKKNILNKKTSSNLSFKNFFKKKDHETHNTQKNFLFPLSSSLDVSIKEKNELLSNFKKK